MRLFLLLTILHTFPLLLSGQEKTFIREYFYKASETDSKVSSRQKALTEVKVLLLEELGTYVESYVNYQVSETDNKVNKDFFTNEIKTLSAGITETKILKENWNGYEYYVKAEIKADPEEVLRRINQTLSIRKSSKVIDSLNILLRNSANEIELKSKELEQIKSKLEKQNEEIQSKQATLNGLSWQLDKAKQQLSKYEAQEKQILSEIEQIERKIRNATDNAINNVRLGMTPEEVKQVCGYPRSMDDCSGLNYNYGSVWVLFESGVVKAVIDARDFEPCRSVSGYKMHNARFIKY